MRRTALFVSIVMAMLLPTGAAMAKTVLGTAGPDLLRGTSAQDTIKGRGGNDDLRGRDHRDELRGGPGNDLVYGMKGADTVIGGVGEDDLYGGPQNDKLRSVGDADPDTINCGTGADDIATIGSGDAVDNNVVTALNIAPLSGDTSCETITLVVNEGLRITASRGVLVP